MVKATRRRDGSEDRSGPAPSPTVVVTNLYRNRPLSFHFSGGSARLGPLEGQVLDRRCLQSPELSHLIATGVVLVTPGPAVGARNAHEDDEPDATTGEK